MVMTGLEWFARRTGPASTAHLQTGGFVRSEAAVSHPDLQFHFLPSQVSAVQLQPGPLGLPRR